MPNLISSCSMFLCSPGKSGLITARASSDVQASSGIAVSAVQYLSVAPLKHPIKVTGILYLQQAQFPECALPSYRGRTAVTLSRFSLARATNSLKLLPTPSCA